MVVLVLLCLTAGFALGLSVRVYALAPVTLAVAVLVAAITLWHGESAGVVIGALLLSAAALQFGYVLGSLAATLSATGKRWQPANPAADL